MRAARSSPSPGCPSGPPPVTDSGSSGRGARAPPLPAKHLWPDGRDRFLLVRAGGTRHGRGPTTVDDQWWRRMFSPAVALPLRCGARWSGFHDPVGFDGTPGTEDALGFRARVAGLLDAHRRARRASVSPCPDDMGELRVVSAHDGGGRSTHSPRLGGTRSIRTAGSFGAGPLPAISAFRFGYEQIHTHSDREPSPVPEAPIERDLPHPRSLTSDRSVAGWVIALVVIAVCAVTPLIVGLVWRAVDRHRDKRATTPPSAGEE